MNRRAYALGVVMVALTMAAAVALRSVAEAAFLARYGARWLPYLYIAHAVTLAASTLGYDRLTQRGGIPAVDTVLVVVLGVTAAAAPTLLGLGGAAPFVVVLAVVALSGVAGLALWNSLAASVAGRDARRALPRAGAAVTLGGAVAGLGAGALIPRVGLAPIAYGAAVLVVAVAAIAAAQRRALASGAPGLVVPPGAGAAMSGDHHALVRWLFAAAAIEAAVATILEVRFNASLKARWSGADLAVAISLFYGGTNAVLFLLQVAIVPRLLVTRRLPVTLSTHPAAVLLAIAGLIAAPGFAALAIARTVDQVLRAATSRTGQEVSLSALPPDPRGRWKVLLRGAATPVGAAAMGAVLVAADRAGASPATLGAIGLGLVAFWIAIVRAAARRFLAAIATPLGLRGLATKGVDRALFDLDQLVAAVAATGAGEPRRAALGRAVLARTEVTSDELVRHLDHEDPAVRAALFDLIAQSPSPGARREVAAAVAFEDDDHALCRGIRALAALGDASGLGRGRGRADLSDDVARTVDAAEVHLGEVTGDAALARLRALAGRDGAWAAAIARAHPTLGAAIDDAITTSTGEPVERWRAAAGAGHPGAVAHLLAALAAGEPFTTEAITELSPVEVEALAAALALAHAPVEARIALARARAAGHAPAALLWTLAADDDPDVRAAALRSLVSHVRAGATVPAVQIAPILDRELDDFESALEHDAEVRHSLRRLLDAAAIEAAATGRDPAPLVALGRRLAVAPDAARRRALDVVQEVAATRPRLLDAIERYVRKPAPAASTATDRVAILRRCPLFADAPPRILETLAASARELDLTAGQALPGDGLVVMPGGEPLGELALVDGGARSVTMPAAGHVIAIDRDAFQSALATCPELGLALAARFASALLTRS